MRRSVVVQAASLQLKRLKQTPANRLAACAAGGVWLLLFSFAVADDDGERLAFFENKVRPLLIKHCYECHSHEEINGGLVLDSREGWSRGGDSGPAIVPGQPEKSLLIKAVRYQDADYEMPPDGKLPDSGIAILENWIASGAVDPRNETPSAQSQTDGKIGPVSADALWSFQPIQETAVPKVSDAAWTVEPIDAFVRARLDELELPPAPPAENWMLLRRIYIDLIGLPPTIEQWSAFETKCREDRDAAVEATVNDLLSSPEFGQRWARHWLDLTAYADTIGVGRSIPAVEAYRYRDYVINAFNKDKLLPEFIRQQIAGDIRVPAAPGQKESQPPTAEDIIATGFLAIGPWELVSGDKVQLRMDVVDRQVNRIGKAFLGMTLECARCHAHKFDPVSQEDYFALAGILRSSVTLDGRLNGVFSQIHHVPLPESADELIERAEWIRQFETELADVQRQVNVARQRQKTLESLKTQLSETRDEPESESKVKSTDSSDKTLSDGNSLDDVEKELAEAKTAFAEANKRLQTLNYLRPHRTTRLAMAMRDGPEPEPAPINIRGNAHQLGQIVPRGFLSSVAPKAKPRFKIGTSGRLDLAEWISHPKNPLTARVWVNRIWHHLFGVGLVRTVDNFGSTGEPPSHPELLDYLAREFQKDWSTKNLIRRIVLSRTWQQSSINSLAHSAGADKSDPGNRHLWRANRRRLDAEVLHDAMLLVSGQLNLNHCGGPSLPLEHADNFNPASTGIVAKELKFPDNWRGRRAIFLPQQRGDPFDEVSFLAAFDLPATNSETGARTVTALPAQALNLVNSDFIRQQSQELAERVAKLDADQRIPTLYRTVYGRMPAEHEIATATEFIESIKTQLCEQSHENPYQEAWSRLCQALLMSNEFLFRT